jgi:hypothetical protein
MAYLYVFVGYSIGSLIPSTYCRQRSFDKSHTDGTSEAAVLSEIGVDRSGIQIGSPRSPSPLAARQAAYLGLGAIRDDNPL